MILFLKNEYLKVSTLYLKRSMHTYFCWMFGLYYICTPICNVNKYIYIYIYIYNDFDVQHFAEKPEGGVEC